MLQKVYKESGKEAKACARTYALGYIYVYVYE